MHAVQYRSSIVLSALVVLVTVGCRGSQPFGSMVRVTQEDESAIPELDPPQQRLATTKPRVDPIQPDGPVSPTSKVVQTSASEALPTDRVSRRTNRASKRSISTIQQASAEQHDRRVDRAVHQRIDDAIATASGPVASAQPVKTKARTGRDATKGSENDAEELMVAFKDYPPEVQREALRRLVAATAKSAERTDQPESVTGRLQDRLADLPALPDSSARDPNAAPPKRIGSKAGSSSSVVSAAVRPNADQPEKRELKQAVVTDLRTSEIDTTPNDPGTSKAVNQPVAAGESRTADAPDAVKPAVANTNSDEPSVAQVSVETQRNTPPMADENEGLQAASAGAFSSGDLFAQLVEQLSQAPAGESEADRASRLIKLRHLMVLSGDPDSAVEQIDGMSEAEQEYLRHQLLGLWTMIDPQGHPVPSRRFSTAIPQIRKAAKFAAAATDSLEVRSLAFCTEIESYGQVKPFKTNRFDAGQQVILYCEIENFTANETDDGFETHLQGTYDLFDEDDEKVVSQLLPADQQISANYLRDYFIAYQMHLPDQLRKGKYRLQLTMEDINGKKYGQASIDLEIKK